MSKTLFNTNTFQSKNVRNSDDVGTLKVDTFKATNAILTNITNAELQAATAGVATNASNISTNTTNIATNTTNISTNATNISNNTTAIEGKEDAFVVTEFNPLKKDKTDTPYLLYVATDTSPTNASNNVVTSGGLYQYLIDNYNALLTAGSGIDITNNTISFEGTSVTGNITTTGTITGNVMNYVDNGVVTNIQTEIESKQNILTDADNAGDGISISGSGVISATGGGGETYSAEANGGLALNENNEFSIDFSNTDARIEIPERIRVETDRLPQILVNPNATTGEDGEIEIRGARNGSTTSRHARLHFTNYDNDLGGTNSLGEIVGRVTNSGSNIGGITFNNYSDGSNHSIAMTMNSNGRFHFGDSFQNNYKLQVTGDCFIDGTIFRKPQMMFYNFNNNSVSSNNWGNGNRFNSLNSSRTTGNSFSSHNDGTITFNQNGYYRIRVGANPVSFGYDNRLAFKVYIHIGDTDYDVSEDYNFHGVTYTRNTTDGAFGNISFEDYIYIASGGTLQVRTKLDINNRSFDDTRGTNQVSCFCNLQIERIAETNIS